MRTLPEVKPTPEQLVIMTDTKPGTVLIRGAAGSGKTTTAVQRLKYLAGFWLRRLRDGYVNPPVRVLVLTFNRTLRGYVEALARGQVTHPDVEVTVSTFGKWSYTALNGPQVVDEDAARAVIRRLAESLPRPTDFLIDETEYAIGRFLPGDLKQYLTVKREGRGISPRMEETVRRQLLDEVVTPYVNWKDERGLRDWNDLAVILAKERHTEPLHIVIVDEAQDFSANQVRAIENHLTDTHTATYVLDAVQRIYPREFTWKEAGVEIADSHRLSSNYRNTAQIAALALPLVADLPQTDDGTLPDFTTCTRPGPAPDVVEGRFSKQMDYVIQRLRDDLKEGQSAAILHARGWFGEVRRRLRNAAIKFVELTRQPEWPEGDEQVALCTMHSSKGLEFDHVFIVGLNDEVTPVGLDADDEDATLQNYRRLLAMAIGRARETVAITYKPQETSRLVGYLDPDTYRLVQL